MSSLPLEVGYYCEGLQLPYRTKGNGRITQKDLQFFRASPYAPEWSGNIHESKLSDIHRPTLARLPIGRLKNHKYKKSAYGGKKSPARAGKKGLPHRPNTADYMTRNNQHAPVQKDEKHKHPYLNITHEEDEKDKAHIVYNRFVPSPLRETQRGTSRWDSRPLGGH